MAELAISRIFAGDRLQQEFFIAFLATPFESLENQDECGKYECNHEKKIANVEKRQV